jgi:F-type H+-transporting ATPase subunit a
LATIKTPTSMLAHLVPLGTPPALMPFIVLIELVRRLIRPLTLSVRLAANIIAGHLLLTLLANNGAPAVGTLLCLIIGALIALCTLECAVSIIQAYVFRVLSTLYLNEVNCPSLD